ncbi:MerR family transcriptional regulator [Planktotalea sp.]|uniref:MerR family transcriptional regulator n=1 Tax=Planktotalea sp. TaxID=2029877 RepID=UPI003D6BA47F
MAKSKDAFRTISEVAEWLETPAHVLRFWESKFTQVKPVKRAGGRRYYRPADMRLLGGIKKLLHDDGLTIKGAQKLLREHGVKHVAELSQPLEEDLLEEAGLLEAAFEPDAQPEPVVDEPATVLSFPNRTEQAAPENVAAPDPVEIPAEAPTQETAAFAEPTAQAETPLPVEAAKDSPEEPTIEPEPEPEPEPESQASAPETSSDAPAFGSDALPAFMRRTPTAQVEDAPKQPQMQETPSGEPEPEAEPAPTAEKAPSKLTIDPVARLQPVETSVDDAQEPAADVPLETAQDDAASESQPPAPALPAEEPAQQVETPAAPMFTHRTRLAETTEPVDASASDQNEDAPAPVQPEEPAPAPAPAIDLPSVAKIAPELASYTAKPGVLAALPGARGISPELADQLSEHLAELRSLRDRMQSH